MFEEECKKVKRDYSKFDQVLDKFMKSKGKTCLVEPFNMYFGFSVPGPNIISMIYDTFMNHRKLYPTAKLVDLGTGSGIYPWLLNREGIAKDDIVAVDLPTKEQLQSFGSCYWDNIVRDNSYTPNADDMVFISWGYGRYASLDRYLLAGGKCVIIIGERRGATLHVDFFSIDWDIYKTREDSDEENSSDIEDVQKVFQGLYIAPDSIMRGSIPEGDLKVTIKGWNTKMYQIDTVNVLSQDYLSINTKYKELL